MTKEEFLQKWSANVVDDVTTDPLFDGNDIESICRLVIRRNVLEMLFDFGCGSLEIHEAISILREWFVNSSPIKL